METPAFNLDGNNAEEFELVDPYNPENTVRGHINRSQNRAYGALYITHVNGRECPQMIWATPKMHYPYNEKEGFYKAPKGSQVEVYEKYDGTNIFAFKYRDADMKPYISYKTRLRPFIGASKFGDFKRLWDEILTDDNIRVAIHSTLCLQDINLSFELFGRRNKILVDYDVPLDHRLLFGVDSGGRIYAPTELEIPNLKKATLVESFPADDNLEKEYQRVREFLNSKLIVVEIEVDGEKKIESMSGMEGAMLYIVSEGGAVQLKAKPDAVQDIHWAESKGIPYHSIYTTIVNAFEETDDPDIPLIKKLLAEEFTTEQIERKYITISKMLETIRFDMKLKVELREAYMAEGFDIVKDKKTCMRWFGERYDKRRAGKIYRFLMDEFGDVNAQ